MEMELALDSQFVHLLYSFLGLTYGERVLYSSFPFYSALDRDRYSENAAMNCLAHCIFITSLDSYSIH